uniref:Uncharacterized protein n=1 Tax=Rhizophora mucronata TaxID=61149 RepID=A0A2P2N9F5_RHIMU
MCREGDVATLKNATWQAIAKLPADMGNVAYLAAWHGNLLVIGLEELGGSLVAHLLDMDTCKWTKVNTPRQYSGHVQTGCFLEI